MPAAIPMELVGDGVDNAMEMALTFEAVCTIVSALVP
jgi:hypothetical protein